VRKVVLARQMAVVMPVSPDMDDLVARLRAENPTTYVFAIGGLVGASPELLVSVGEGLVRSVTLAGTTTSSDGLDDPRIILEHDLAAESVAAGLDPHIRSLTTSRSVIEVGRMKHIATTFEGVMRPGRAALDVLSTLHPTAAVAGTPTQKALELIRQNEPQPRGRYAGPVGWFDDKGNGEFAIALRCGKFEDDRATLYAGGGLVSGSELETEWSETEAKLQPMLSVLGLD
jgi:menaquinone-specific isochorismate synthase